jgi:outer membrane lipase/esterase
MKRFAGMCAIIAAFVSCTALAEAQPYYSFIKFSNLYSFGDSLSDIGNGNQTPITTPDGATWNFYLAQQLGFNLTASKNGGNDYALAGSVTGPLPAANSSMPLDPTHFGFPAQTILDQVNGYVITSGGHLDKNALYTVYGGANDIVLGLESATTQNFTPVQATEYALKIINASANNILTAAQTLYAAGAKFILVPNLPNLGKTPALSDPNFLYAQFYQVVYQMLYKLAISLGQTTTQASAYALAYAPAEAQAIVASENSALIQASTELAENFNHQQLSDLNRAGFNVIQVDIFGLLEALQQNYQAFGFSAPNSSYESVVIDGKGVPSLAPNGSDPNTDIFFDGYHPSAKTGQIGADYFLSIITGPLFAGNLAIIPFSVIDNQNNIIQQQMLSLQTCLNTLPVGKFSVFAGGLDNPGSVDTAIGQPGFTWNNAAFTVGSFYRFNQNFLAGAAVGRSMGDIDYKHNTGGLDLDENIVTLFGGYQWNNFYSNAELNYGNIDFSNIKRNFNLGPVPETVIGDTSGYGFAAGDQLGYNFSFMHDNLKTGPIATLDYQHVNVSPYAEYSADFSAQGNPFDALQYGKQQNNSFVGGLGWQINYVGQVNNTQVMPFMQATYNHQFINQDRWVTAGVVTLPGSEFAMPFTYPDNHFGSINAGVQSLFDTGLTLTLAVNAIVGQSDLNSHTFMLSASMPV